MMSSITPVGERARGQRWSVTAAAHLVGAVAGGGLLGWAAGTAGWSVAWVVGPVNASTAGVLLLGVAAAGALLERGPLATPVPTLHRQVDERWLDAYRGWVYGGGYGAQLGLGVVTVVPTWATPAMIVAMVLTASPYAGATIGAVFGLSRALPVLATAPLTEPGRLWRFHERVERWGDLAASATAVGLGALATVLAATIVLGGGA